MVAAKLWRSELRTGRSKEKLKKCPKLIFIVLACSMLFTWQQKIAAAIDNTTLTTEVVLYDLEAYGRTERSFGEVVSVTEAYEKTGRSFIGPLTETEAYGRTERSFGGPVVEPPQRPKSVYDNNNFRPYFDETTDRNVTYQLSKPSYLLCRIKQLGDQVVSWVRQRDLHILTVGTYTYTTDQRYSSLHLENTDDWTLEIKYTQKQDAGVYECQVSTEPKMSLPIQLNVVIAIAEILEGSMLYVQKGSALNMTCVVSEYNVPPVYVFWYQDGRMVDYQAQLKRGANVVTETGETVTTSRFMIEKAQLSDSGFYSCQATFSDPVNITVHVLNGENTAAMQHGHTGSQLRLEFNVEMTLICMMMSFYIF